MPKHSNSKKTEETAETDKEPEHDKKVEAEVDVENEKFSQYRYKGPPEISPSDEYRPKLVKVSVYKARKFWCLRDIRSGSEKQSSDHSARGTNSMSLSSKTSSKFNWLSTCEHRSVHAHHNDRLSLSTKGPEKLTICSSNIQDFVKPQCSVYIRKPREDTKTFQNELSASHKKESHSLECHRKEKKHQLRQENDMMEKSGKNRESLLLRRHQMVPKISDDDFERVPSYVQRSVTPKTFPDWVLWAPIIYDTKEKNGIRPTLRKCQRGYDVITDRIGHPEITDELRKDLDLNSAHIASSLKQNKETVCGDIPSFPRLGVLGFNYNNIQNSLKLPVRKMVVLENEKQMKSSAGTATSPRHASARSVKQTKAQAQSSASLCLGHVHLRWSSNPQRSSKTWVVELGCSAELHRSCIDYVMMRNTGTTAIRFTWTKLDSNKPLQRPHSDAMRIIFDSCDRVILPGQAYRIPFMYKAVTAGQYTEDWKLLTQPVLENGANIILRLWGFTRQVDQQQSLVHKPIEDSLQRHMSLSIVRHIVQKLVDHLPLDGADFGCSQNDLLCAPLKGPDIFTNNNPWLYYNSYHVSRLGKIASLIKKELKKQNDNSAPDLDTILPLEATQIGTPDIDDQTPTPPLADVNAEPDRDRANVKLGHIKEELRTDVENSVSEEVINLRGEIGDNKQSDFNISRPGEISEINDVSSSNEGEDEDPKSNELSEHSPSEEFPKTMDVQPSITVLDTNISVNSIRQDLLKCKENQIRQDAMFTLLSEEVSHLLFKPFRPCENWKITLVKRLFSRAVEVFDDFALDLKDACYMAKYIAEIAKMNEIQESTPKNVAAAAKSGTRAGSIGTTTSLLSTVVQSAPSKTNGSSKEQIPTKISEMDNSERLPADVLGGATQIDNGSRTTPSLNETSCPRVDLEPERYKDQYYGRLYSRMYWLLADMCDSIDTLIYQPPKIDPRYGRDVFIKIDKVPRNVDIKNELVKPLPPKWVNILNKMNKIKRAMNPGSSQAREQRNSWPLEQ